MSCVGVCARAAHRGAQDRSARAHRHANERGRQRDLHTRSNVHPSSQMHVLLSLRRREHQLTDRSPPRTWFAFLNFHFKTTQKPPSKELQAPISLSIPL